MFHFLNWIAPQYYKWQKSEKVSFFRRRSNNPLNLIIIVFIVVGVFWKHVDDFGARMWVEGLDLSIVESFPALNEFLKLVRSLFHSNSMQNETKLLSDKSKWVWKASFCSSRFCRSLCKHLFGKALSIETKKTTSCTFGLVR